MGPSKPERAADAFADLQRRHFELADAERFQWTTRAPGFAESEDELLAPLLRGLAVPALEIGCGEGNNLARLSDRSGWCGIDFSPRKLGFARRELPSVGFAAADAGRLPFADGFFRSVFVRDLLHHVPAPVRVLSEAARVLAAGGELLVLEPNPRNPLIWAQSRAVAAESGIRRGGADVLRVWLAEAGLDCRELATLQPLPLRRLLLHYRFGVPRLGRSALARRLLLGAEGGVGRLLPRSCWSYVLARGAHT